MANRITISESEKQKILGLYQLIKEDTIDNEEGHYEGETQNGKPHGKGTLHNISSESDGKIYVSPLRPNFHHYQFTYTGDFENGLPNGEGKIKFENGDIYEGEFYNGKIEGIGKMTFQNGSVYEGEFETTPLDSLNSTYNVKTKNQTIQNLVKYNNERPRVTDVYSDLTKGEKTKGMFKSGGLEGRVTLSDETEKVQVLDGDKSTFNGKPLISLTDANDKRTTATVKLQNKNIKSINYTQETDYEGYFNFDNVEYGTYLLSLDTKNKISDFNDYEIKIDDPNNKELTIVLFKKNKRKEKLKESLNYNSISDLINEGGNQNPMFKSYEKLYGQFIEQKNGAEYPTEKIYSIGSVDDEEYWIGVYSENGKFETMHEKIDKFDKFAKTYNLKKISDEEFDKLKNNLKSKPFCKSGNCADGNGTILDVDGTTYTGPFVGGKKEGIGEKKYTDGSIFKGNFSADIIKGQGTLTTYNGCVVTGEWDGEKLVSSEKNKLFVNLPISEMGQKCEQVKKSELDKQKEEEKQKEEQKNREKYLKKDNEEIEKQNKKEKKQNEYLTTTKGQIESCEKLVQLYYETYESLYNKKQSIDDFDKSNLISQKNKITVCHARYSKKLSNKTLTQIKRLSNVSPKLEFMELELQISENTNIYNKTDNMLKGRIRNIIKEQKDIKSQMLVEEDIINKRFDFLVESLIKNGTVGDNQFLMELRKEKIKMINSGYNKLMVQNSFSDIMNTFF
jgi:hypothetical protein